MEDYLLFASACLIIIIIIIILCIYKKSSKEGFVRDRTMFNGLPRFTARSLSTNDEDHNTSQYGSKREGFFAMGEPGYVDAMGDIAGPRVMTNGILTQDWDDVKKKVVDNTYLENTDEAIGSTKGNGFDDAYQAYKEVQDLQESDDTGVRSPEHIEKINKQINTGLNNNGNNLISRGGATKARIMMNPLGTVGVLENGAAMCPERERNHKIYSVGHAVLLPSYDMSSNGADVYAQFTRTNEKQPTSGWSKNFAPTSNKIITTVGDETTDSAVITGQAEAAESFTSEYFN